MYKRQLEDILKEHLELDKVTLIPCGQGSEIDAAREQWSDGSNTLAIGPGEVVEMCIRDRAWAAAMTSGSRP